MVTLIELYSASPDEIIAYGEQLRTMTVAYLDRVRLAGLLGNPSLFLEYERIEKIRSIAMQYNNQLVPLVRPRVETTNTTNTTNTLTIGPGRLYVGSRSNPDQWQEIGSARISELAPVLRPFHEEPASVRHGTRSWELSFTEEEEEGDPYTLEEMEKVVLPYIREEEPELPREKILTLKEIAEKIPPGILGMQFDGDGRPYNLVFRAEREDDPRKKLLQGYGWFEVRKQEKVLWAATTLEAYNTLVETGIEFKQTDKVERWWQYINSDGRLIGFDKMFAEPDCPLFDWQREAVQFLVRRKRALLALSPGLGKTLTAAYAASLLEYVGTVLLVCPASLLHYWYSELNKWSPHMPMKPMAEVWHKETGTKPELADLPQGTQFWAITNPETLSRHLKEFMFDAKGAQNFWDLMIVDESIMYKHRDSKRSQAVNDMARAVPDLWLLSGAPATRFLDDMWHQFHMLSNRGYPSYWRFAETYCKIDDNEWSKTVIANRRGAEEEIKANFRDVYFARNQDQVANIPDWLFVDMDIPMKPKQEAVYHKLNKELRIKIEGWEDDYVMEVDDRLTLTLRSLQIASNPVLVGADNSSGKWSALPELMEFYEGPYLVWVTFVRTGEMLREMLGEKYGVDRVALANGSTPMLDRQLLVDGFQAGKLDVLILNNQVGKFGFTLTKARTSFFVERGYDDSYFQCLHRNRRIGTTQSPVVVNMRSCTQAGGRTIDHVVHDALDYRNTMIKKITVGDIRKILDDE